MSDQRKAADALDFNLGLPNGYAMWCAGRLMQLIGVEGKSRAEARAIIDEEQKSAPWASDGGER